MGERIRYISMSFADNATESGVVKVSSELGPDEAIVGVDIPAGFQGTTLKFKNCVDGTNYNTVLATDGTDYTITCAASRYAPIDPLIAKGFNDIKGVASSQTSGPLELKLVATKVA